MNGNIKEIYTINLAGLIVDVHIDNTFEKIKDFINRFGNSDNKNRDTKLRIFFLKGNGRKLELSEKWDSLSIVGDKIDDLSDPFNLIGITQALFRFAAIHLATRGVFLLHGSTAVLDNKVVCFGDDGNSTAKTLGSLEIALESRHYVADEFCFFDIKNQKIFGYPFIPIHIRPVVKNHLKSSHNIILPKDDYKVTSAGEFVTQEKLFETVSGRLNALAYIHFSEKNSLIERLSQKEAYKSFKFCIASHIAKLLYPSLDRMWFASMTDTDEAKVIHEKTIDDIFTKITIGNEIDPQILKRFTSYKLTISDPCQIVPLLKKEMFQVLL